MINKQAYLVLADGSIYKGTSIGAEGEAVGELVFNTSMTGYQEILSDPSYCRQIVTLTTAQVGNTGCNLEDMESDKAWASGLVIRNASKLSSNHRSQIDFNTWLQQKGIVAIADIDTRALTIKLRDQGAIAAVITTKFDNLDEAQKKAQAFAGLEGADLASEVSCNTICEWREGLGAWGLGHRQESYHLVAYDFGVKHNILRLLYDAGCKITLVPAKTSAEEVIKLKPDGILLSNGPGDPLACHYAIEATKTFLKKDIPIMGICLGFQILAIAGGARTFKMKFGHHGANHPVMEVFGKKRVFITSQNHGFAVDETNLPNTITVTHRSLFDNTLQGIRIVNKAAFGFQGHPEASPGPHDIIEVFHDFVEAMKVSRAESCAL